MKTGLCGTVRLPGSCGGERDFRKKYGETDADDIVCNEPLRDEHVAIGKNTNRKLNDMGDAFKAGRGQVRRIRETGESISVLHENFTGLFISYLYRPNVI